MKTEYVKYVRFADIEDHHKLGWLLFNEPLHYPHGAYSVGMKWLCDCKCVWPK